MTIRTSNYKNKKSVVLENDHMLASFIPEPGGKMVSLISKETGYEFLVQRHGDVYRDQPYNGIYIEGECSGYDDMFPTIDNCIYQNDPWKGVEMGDHGEVWCMPWDCTITENRLELSVTGKRFPYTLYKTVFFTSNDTLRIAYRLENKSGFDFEFLWAGHFMFNMEEGTQVIVPWDCKRAISILTNTGKSYGEEMDWPDFKDGKGNLYRADIARHPSNKGFEKYYFRDALKEGRCELKYPDRKKKITISFPVHSVPYLGILMNEKGWDDLYNIFIEPCTVCYDRPDLAKQHGQVSKVNGNSSYEWYIDLTL